MPGRPLLSLAFALGLGSCVTGDSDSSELTDWKGTQRDSSGVRIVENPIEGVWAEGAGWVVERDLSIGVLDGPEDLQFGHVSDVDVGPDSRIYVLDHLAGLVRVFESDGSFAYSFGRFGDGPGEFTPGSVRQILLHDNELFLPDAESRRAHRFRTDGSLIETIRLPFWPSGGWSVHPEGGFLVSPLGDRLEWAGLVRVARTGVVTDTVVVFDFEWATRPANVSSWSPLLLPGPTYAVTTDGKIVTGIVDQYRIEVRDVHGDVERIITKPEGGRRLSDDGREALILRARQFLEDRLSARGELDPTTRAIIANTEWFTPERLPAFTGLHGGPEGTIWVQGVLPIDQMTEDIRWNRSGWRGAASSQWDVFSREGRFLGEVLLPPRTRLRRISGDFIYAVEMDELGVQRVVRLRIRRTDRMSE